MLLENRDTQHHLSTYFITAPLILSNVTREPGHTAPLILSDVTREPGHRAPLILSDVTKELGHTVSPILITYLALLENQDIQHHLSYLILLQY